MSNEDLILAELRNINGRLDKMDGRLDKMDGRLDCIEEKLEDLIEDHKITREGVNRLIDWTEQAGYIIKYPFAQ